MPCPRTRPGRHHVPVASRGRGRPIGEERHRGHAAGHGPARGGCAETGHRAWAGGGGSSSGCSWQPPAAVPAQTWLCSGCLEPGHPLDSLDAARVDLRHTWAAPCRVPLLPAGGAAPGHPQLPSPTSAARVGSSDLKPPMARMSVL